MQWAYGITTVPERLNTTFTRTLNSLKESGFDRPTLFIDGLQDSKDYRYLGFKCDIVTRYPRIRTYGNWILALWELYIRNPSSDRYAIFQDDLVTGKNLKAYLEKWLLEDKTYWNLYTFPENQAICPVGVTGWYPSNQTGKGAVALIFGRDSIEALLSSKHMMHKPKDAHRGWRNVDGAVVDSLKEEDPHWLELVHNPSLVQHTGALTSMGSNSHPLAESFRGEDFDFLTLEVQKIHKINFTGRWRICDENGQLSCYFILANDNTAVKTHAANAPGTYEIVNDESVVIRWSDGFIDVIKWEEDMFRLLTWGPKTDYPNGIPTRIGLAFRG